MSQTQQHEIIKGNELGRKLVIKDRMLKIKAASSETPVQNICPSCGAQSEGFCIKCLRSADFVKSWCPSCCHIPPEIAIRRTVTNHFIGKGVSKIDTSLLFSEKKIKIGDESITVSFECLACYSDIYQACQQPSISQFNLSWDKIYRNPGSDRVAGSITQHQLHNRPFEFTEPISDSGDDPKQYYKPVTIHPCTLMSFSHKWEALMTLEQEGLSDAIRQIIDIVRGVEVSANRVADAIYFLRPPAITAPDEVVAILSHDGSPQIAPNKLLLVPQSLLILRVALYVCQVWGLVTSNPPSVSPLRPCQYITDTSPQSRPSDHMITWITSSHCSGKSLAALVSVICFHHFFPDKLVKYTKNNETVMIGKGETPSLWVIDYDDIDGIIAPPVTQTKTIVFCQSHPNISPIINNLSFKYHLLHRHIHIESLNFKIHEFIHFLSITDYNVSDGDIKNLLINNNKNVNKFVNSKVEELNVRFDGSNVSLTALWGDITDKMPIYDANGIQTQLKNIRKAPIWYEWALSEWALRGDVSSLCEAINVDIFKKLNATNLTNDVLDSEMIRFHQATSQVNRKSRDRGFLVISPEGFSGDWMVVNVDKSTIQIIDIKTMMSGVLRTSKLNEFLMSYTNTTQQMIDRLKNRVSLNPVAPGLILVNNEPLFHFNSDGLITTTLLHCQMSPSWTTEEAITSIHINRITSSPTDGH